MSFCHHHQRIAAGAGEHLATVRVTSILRLVARYRQMATEIHGGQVPDLEWRHAWDRDALKSPRTIDTA